jgi:hypothetical protein
MVFKGFGTLKSHMTCAQVIPFPGMDVTIAALAGKESRQTLGAALFMLSMMMRHSTASWND